jgi:hypothetical protein
VAARRVASPPSSSAPSGGQVSLPHLVLDPVWSLKQWPVVIDVAGQELTIPAMCAADWLHVLMNPELQADDVFPGLLGQDDRAFVEDQLHSSALALDDAQELALEIISQVSGRPWWVSLRLITIARTSWDALGGEMVEKVDASRLPLGGWLDTLFLLIVRTIDDAKRNMFLMKLELAPEGWGPPPEEAVEMSADAFMAMAG